MISIKDNQICLETKNTSLVFSILDYEDNRTPFNKNKKFIVQSYYGLKKNKPDNIVGVSNLCPNGSSDEYNLSNLISTTNGSGNNSETSLLLTNSDGTNVNRFFLIDAKIIKGAVDVFGPHARNVTETLEIIELDEVLNIELHHYYSLCEDSDVIVAKRKLINNGKKPLTINRFFSLECPIPSHDLNVYTFDGKWLYERNRHTTHLTSGIYFVDSKVGSSSHKHNPFIEIQDITNNLFYGFNFIYSGNHKETVDVNFLFNSAVYVGLNDYGFNYPLNKGESFITPEAIMVVAESLDGISKSMHQFCLKHIVEQKFAYAPRPIIFNNWEGTGLNINEETLIAMAEVAKKVGVEQFVMDDGWFKNRATDNGGLGDWQIDKNKFPNGLKPFTDKVKEMGLKFGIWVEPEMICINSDLYRAHPEFASIIPNREPIEKRHQLMIDMTNPKVVDYLFENLSNVFSETNTDYVKWDYNRFFIDSYSSIPENNGTFAYKFMQGTYNLIERLKEKFPNILFESCSSGGGRFDLGMIYYMPQTWGSDDTNSYCRSFIACGTLAGYPQSTYGAHVSVDGCPLPNRKKLSHLEDRFNLHAAGAFGYEFDFRKRTPEELDIIAKQIKYYKEHRMLFQYGQYYVCANCFDDANYYSYSLVSENQEEALLYISELEENAKPRRWIIKGLNPDFKYIVEMRQQANALNSFKHKMLGKELMQKGINVGSIFKNTKKRNFNGTFSRLFYIKKVD